MKKIICMFLLCAILFSLSGCSMTKEPKEHIPEIIENYDKYSEVLSDKGIESKIEDARTKFGVYMNDSGKVLTVFSPDERQYVFYYKIGDNDSSFRGDACHIYREGKCTLGSSDVKYKVSICTQFRTKVTKVSVSYREIDGSNFGSASYHYLDGNFTPDLSDIDQKSFLHTNFQERDSFIKSFVRVNELSACYNQACEYYETLCSVVED